jgi:hypothetical protein
MLTIAGMTKRLPPELRKRPGQNGALIGVRFQPGELAKVDAWIAAHTPRGSNRPAMSRPEAIRQIVAADLSTAEREELEALRAAQKPNPEQPAFASTREFAAWLIEEGAKRRAAMAPEEIEKEEARIAWVESVTGPPPVWVWPRPRQASAPIEHDAPAVEAPKAKRKARAKQSPVPPHDVSQGIKSRKAQRT